MIPMTLAQIAQAVGGTLHDVDDPSATVSGTVEFDSRKITPGGLFLALPGARVDGHDHAAGAVAAGAVAVLAARPVGVPAIVVEPLGTSGNGALALEHDRDGSGAAVLAALGKLARASVDRLTTESGLTVVGVTGSSGKTSTKDLLAAVLSPLGSVVAPPGSFNNELGHPWTALRADADTRFLVLEMSARGRGHIGRSRRSHHPVSEWSSTSVPRISASSARARRSRRPRANCPRRCRPRPTAEWRSSTPTTRWSRRWRTGPRRAW